MNVTNRQLFLNYLGQTSDAPMAIEAERAEGSFIYGPNGEKHLDIISGISVSNVGHCHPKVVKAIQDQAATYMHLMVYGEYIQSPQVKLAEKLSSILPEGLDQAYFVNSGSEAIEGAMKLAKRYTGRTKIVSCVNAYHGSTHGALSIMGSEEFKNAFRPLLPNTHQINYNNFKEIQVIDTNTAAIVIEAIQGEAGAILPSEGYLEAIKARCEEVGALMIIDEVQTGLGRSGSMFAFQAHELQPDILVLAKGLGGGMPIGAFISSQKIMASFMYNPVLGHITTFGGHPVSAAASLACINVILEENLLEEVPSKHNIIRSTFENHDKVKEVRGKGLICSIQLESTEFNFAVIKRCIEKGVLTDWFLFCDDSLRIAPPLTISHGELQKGCDTIIEAINEC